MLPPTALHGLSAAATTTLRDFDAAFAAQERGGVRDGNDRTTQSRADHFVRWLDDRNITGHHHLAGDSPKRPGDIKRGIKSTRYPAGTVAGYIKVPLAPDRISHPQPIWSPSLVARLACILY
jgi:hypothetical protein